VRVGRSSNAKTGQYIEGPTLPKAHTIRKSQHPPGNMAVMVNASRPGLKTLEDAQEAAGG
jgi:crotonyl-CoA carboxylase/reductase